MGKEEKLLEIMLSFKDRHGLVPGYRKEYEEMLGVGRRAIYVYLNKLINNGRLIKRSHAKYEIVPGPGPKPGPKPGPRLATSTSTGTSTSIAGSDSTPSNISCKDDVENIATLVAMYKENIKDDIGKTEEHGIKEMYMWLKSRNIDATDYITDAIIIMAHKKPEKRVFKYFVGMLRYWAMHGKWAMPTEEEKTLRSLFEKLSGVEISEQAAACLQDMISTHGVIYVASAMTKALSKQVEFDLSLYLMNMVKEELSYLTKTN